MDLQGRVAKALQKLDKSNDELAQILGVNRNTISAYKKKKGDLKGIVLVGLSEKFGYNPEWLLTGNGEMFLSKKISPAQHIKGDHNGLIIQNSGSGSVVQTGGRAAEGQKGPDALTEPKMRAMALFNRVIASDNPEVIQLVLGNLEAVAGLLGERSGESS